MYNKMLMVKYTAEQTLTSNNPPEIAGDPCLLCAVLRGNYFYYLGGAANLPC